MSDNFLIIYANSDGETRIKLKTEKETVDWLAEYKPELIITEPPEPDPNYWPEGAVLIRAVKNPGFAPLEAA